MHWFVTIITEQGAKPLEEFTDRFINFSGVKSRFITNVFSHHEDLDPFWEISAGFNDPFSAGIFAEWAVAFREREVTDFFICVGQDPDQPGEPQSPRRNWDQWDPDNDPHKSREI